MPPLLAREAVTAAALSGDPAALRAAHASLSANDSARYDRRRAAAFVAALSGDRALALRELGLGAGARSLRLGVDAAVIELLTRGPAHALDALRAALDDGAHSEPDVPLVLAECVRRAPDTARSALVVALSGGSWAERTLAAAAVLRVARPAQTAAVPALVVVALAVAVVAFVRLPAPDAGEPTVAPTLRERPSPAIVAQPSVPPPATVPRARRQQLPAAGGVSQIDVRERVLGARSTAAAAPAQQATLPPRLRHASPPAPSPTASPAPAPPAAPTTAAPPAAASASAAAPAAAPTAEPTPLVFDKRAVRAARKAAQAERKAAQAAAKSDRAAPAPPAAAVAERDPVPQGPPPAAAEHGRDDKPEKPDKSK